MINLQEELNLLLFYSSEVAVLNSGEVTAIGRRVPETDRNLCRAIPTSVRFEMPTTASGLAIMLSLRLSSCIGLDRGFSSQGHQWRRRIRTRGLARLSTHRRDGQLMVTISSLGHSKCGHSSGLGPRSLRILERGSTAN